MREGEITPASDRDLVVEFQRGHGEAFDEIFKRYHSRVAGICYRMLGSSQDAEEATQETFLKAYQALGRFNGSYYLGAWLGRIATNVCVDHLRVRSRSNLVALPEDRDDLLTEDSPEDVVVGDHPRLEEAIREIQPLHASALALRTLEGMSHQEIAGRLSMTPSQVKALLHRARSSLRRAWDKAEGWALAPLLGVRFLHNRGTAGADRLASVSPSAAPFLMEKVAASAMIVAAALTGLPSTPDESEVTDKRRRVPAATAGQIQQESRIDAAGPGHVAAGDAAAPGPSSSGDAIVEPEGAIDLLAEVERALAAPEEQSSQPEESSGSEKQEDDPLGPHAAEGEKVKKKVQKVVRRVEEQLGP